MKASGRRVVTIEGLAKDGRLHPLQEAFVNFGAVQCGFCIPGQIMTAAALLEGNPDPAESEIRDALKDTLCRCAGYPSIVRAVQAAARSLRTGEPVAQSELPEASSLVTVGRIVPRPDAIGKVDGSARFADDRRFSMLHGRTLRRVPHGLTALDVTKAKRSRECGLDAVDILGETTYLSSEIGLKVGVGKRCGTSECSSPGR
jgi:xanthine dehydrogenase molybdenum-binding subunit